MLKVLVKNKSTDTIKVKVTLKQDESDQNQLNLYIPVSFISESLYQSETKCIGHFIKIDSTLPFTQLKIEIEATKKQNGAAAPVGYSGSSIPNPPS